MLTVCHGAGITYAGTYPEPINILIRARHCGPQTIWDASVTRAGVPQDRTPPHARALSLFLESSDGIKERSITGIATVLAAGIVAIAAPAPSAISASDHGSWSEAVAALALRNQSWAGRQASPRSDFQFDIGCIGDGPAQSPQFTDIFDAVSNWFSGSNTGPTCASNQARGVNCSAGTGCFYQGSYAVWNNGIADCFSFVALQNAVKLYCADAGHQDCGCGVYYDFGSGKCLVASYTYHVSGPSTVNNEGITGEPVDEVTNVNFNRRDSLGPYYTDLEICGHTGSGDVSAWCESSATHVC